MNRNGFLATAAVALMLSTATTGAHLTGFSDMVWAKGGDGGGNGGGNGGGGGHGNSDHGNSGHSNSGKSDAKEDKGASSTKGQTQKENARRDAEDKQTKKSAAASPAPSELKGLNSLKRNYNAYLNTSDPRMTAISAYVRDYAQYEIDMGVAPTIDDPVLGDEALRDALGEFTGQPVTDKTLDWAKDVLGVGTAEGKIDQVRDTLDEQAAVDSE